MSQRDFLDLKVTNMIKSEDALSNFVFLSTADYAEASRLSISGVVKISGHYFSIRPHNAVETGYLATSVVQRSQLQVVKDNVVRVTRVLPGEIAAEPAEMLKLEVEVKQGRGTSVDCQLLAQTLCKKLETQCLAVGRQLLLQVEGLLLGLTVVDIQLKGAKGAGAVFTGGRCAFIVSTASLSPEDVVITTANEKLSLTNTSMKQMDAQQQQIVQSFNLENLGIGGLREEFGKVFQRAFASRMLPPSYLKKLGIKHVKGVLLYGPPGTGKTLIARKIGEILNCREPKIVNGPEVFNKFVGGTEENIRKLFTEAEEEQASKGEQSQLHLIIFDEFDAICKQRGAVRDSTGVNDNVVNQLLSKIDGVNSLNNVLLIGMTNRPDLIDDAIKRPGRFEVHVEIGLPNEEGRLEIFRIHTLSMRENGKMATDVNLAELAAKTENYSGAEIEGVVRAAVASALHRHIDLENAGGIVDPESIMVTSRDFEGALEEVLPAFGRANAMCDNMLRGGIMDYGEEWRQLWARLCSDTALLGSSTSRVDALTLLLHGPAGCGKSAVAAALSRHTAFPYVKVLCSDDMVGYGDLQRVNIIRKAFEDAYKSPSSCIILDDMERLMNFSALGGRYSNDILQALLVLVKRPPPPGHKILVIGTTCNYVVTRELELDSVFSLKAEVPLVSISNVAALCRAAGYTFDNQSLESEITGMMRQAMPIKQLLLVFEMAADADKRIGKEALSMALKSSY